MLGAGALGRPRGMVWGGRRKEGSGWGTHNKVLVLGLQLVSMFWGEKNFVLMEVLVSFEV